MTDCDAAIGLVYEWGISFELAQKLIRFIPQAEDQLQKKISIISGWRSESKQAHLLATRPNAAPDNLSTHRSCPATGADLQVGPSHAFVTRAQKQIFGRLAVENGMRWGGGSRPDQFGIPADWNHVDLGPRNQ